MTIATQSPTDSYGTAQNPANAYSSNNVYAILSLLGQLAGYKNYGFDGVLPSSIDISKVEIGLEMYHSRPCDTEATIIRISVDNGTTWSGWSDPFCIEIEDIIWIDVTAFQNPWLRDYLLDANWRIEAKFKAVGGTGCPFKEAWSCHLDWIPTRVTYEEIEEIIKAHSGSLLNPGIF